MKSMNHPAFCSVDGCDKSYDAKGLCGTHYMQMSRHGKILRATIMSSTNEYDLFGSIAVVYTTDRLNRRTGYFTVDKAVLADVLRHRWCREYNGYIFRKEFGRSVRLHREIMRPTDKQ